MSTITRTLRNLRKVGIKDAWKQMQYIGDTKAGTLVGTDRFGNKYFENDEELPLRTRWIEYKAKDVDASQMEPGWRAWISHAVTAPPTEDSTLRYQRRSWEDKDAATIPNYTLTRGAYKPYSTTKSKITMWEPFAVERK